MGLGIKNKLIKAAVVGGALYLLNRIIKTANQLDLKGKVVLITGGSRGLGLTLARQLNLAGAKVVICSRNADDLKESAKQLKDSEYLTVTCDITNRNEVKDLVAQAIDKFGSIDVLINNAGTIQTGPVDAMTEEDFENALKIHFWGPFYLINEVMPYLPEKEGRIVNISSIGGKISFPHLIPYNTSKFALAGYSEGITAELSRKGIRVTTVYPGLMRTGSPRNIIVKGDHKKEYAWFKISDSLPGLSINAELAAKRIISAMRRGDRALTLSIPAKLALAIEGIAPSLNISLFNLINRVLPNPENPDRTPRKGFESTSKASNSFLTRKTDRAAEKNNEM